MSTFSRGRLLFLHLLCVCYCFGVNFPVVISVRLRATALVCFGRPVYVWSVRLVDHFRKVGPVYCFFFFEELPISCTVPGRPISAFCAENFESAPPFERSAGVKSLDSSNGFSGVSKI